MYVRWKVLLGLGTAFWLLLCLLDYFPTKHIDHLILHNKEENKIKDEILPQLEQNKTDDSSFGFVKVMLWNLVAFASTITVCFALKTISSKLNIINNQAYWYDHGDKLAVRKTSSSRIPIPITSKSSSTDIHIEGGDQINAEGAREPDYNKSCPNLLGSQNSDGRSMEESKKDKKIWSIKVMEKHCAKLREEMINLQAVSLKEQSAVAKKVESLSKEKRELTKQYNSILKENKSLKKQVDEMIEERAFLVKRLECATKEMKNATKNKKATVAKLDEAVTNAESLKSNLEQIKRDKSILEDKLIILDAEYKRLKGEMELYKQKGSDLETRLSHKRSTKESIKSELAESDVVTQTEEFDAKNSDQDIKKVAQKLLKLEKSLESFKLRHAPKKDSTDDCREASGDAENEMKKTGSKEIPDNTPKEAEAEPKEALVEDYKEALELLKKPRGSTSSFITDDSEVATVCLDSEHGSKTSLENQPSTNSICTELDCPLEHKECTKVECFLRRKHLEADLTSSGEDVGPLINYKEYNAARKKVQKLKSSISDDRLSVISELATSTGEESGDDWNEPKRRFVTHSAAFQKFLRESIEAQKMTRISCNSISN